MPKSTTEPAQLLLLDTHVAVWLAESSDRLTPALISKIERAFADRLLCFSPILAWEIGMLCSTGRLRLSPSPGEWMAKLIREFEFEVLELTPAIAVQSNFLPGTLHADPSDRILIATARANNAVLVTADTNIIEYSEQGFVRILSAR